MALNKAALEADILMVINDRLGQPYACASRWAKSYSRYALNAQSCQLVTPVPAGIQAAELVLTNTFAAIFSQYHDVIASSQLWGTALSSFWIAPPQTFIASSPGIITVADPVVMGSFLKLFMTQNLSRIQSRSGINNEEIARQFATALDAATRTVIAAHGPSPACVATLI